MRGRVRALAAAALLALALAGCATFPDEGPRTWQDQIEEPGTLGDIPRVPVPSEPPPTGTPPPEDPSGGPPPAADPCDDPDPQVVATCLDPVGAIAVLPDGATALVGERATGRILQVARDVEPVLVATVPVDPTGGGGLTGLVLSPSFVEDQLLYAYTTTAQDNRVVRIAPGEEAKPVLTGIARGAENNGGALGVDVDGSLLVATGNAGAGGPLAGALLRIDTFGRPGEGNPDPASPVLSTGLTAPGGICTDPVTTMTWITDRTPTADVLHLVTPGTLGSPAWRWPERPGVAGCMAQPGVVAVAETGGAALFVLRPDENATFTGDPEILLPGVYGRLAAATLAPDGLLWLGTVNKDDGGTPVASDDRVIRIQPPAGGGASRA